MHQPVAGNVSPPPFPQGLKCSAQHKPTSLPPLPSRPACPQQSTHLQGLRFRLLCTQRLRPLQLGVRLLRKLQPTLLRLQGPPLCLLSHPHLLLVRLCRWQGTMEGKGKGWVGLGACGSAVLQ